MSVSCVTKSEAGKLLGVSLRMVTNYLQSGELTIDHKEGNKVMIRVDEVFSLREQRRKRG